MEELVFHQSLPHRIQKKRKTKGAKGVGHSLSPPLDYIGHKRDEELGQSLSPPMENIRNKRVEALVNHQAFFHGKKNKEKK
jgi:hypothetical protein